VNEGQLVEENIQSLPLEETQDLTIPDDSLYLEEEIDNSNPINVKRKILSRNVNNTSRRNFR